MGLFSGRKQLEHPVRGGCSTCDMHGPARSTFKKANKDAIEHGKRMHGRPDFYGGYIEAVVDRPKSK